MALFVQSAYSFGFYSWNIIPWFYNAGFEHFGFEFLKPVAAVDLIICAFAAWYMMAGIIITDLAGIIVLPLGKKLVN